VGGQPAQCWSRHRHGAADGPATSRLIAANPSTTRLYYPLLSEAFVGEEPRRAFRQNDSTHPYSSLQSRAFLAALLAHSDELPAPSVLRPYWPTRQGRGPWRLTREDLYRRFAQLIADTRRAGYLDSAFAEPCPSSDEEPKRARQNVVLAERLGRRNLWPLKPQRWDEDTFYGLIEAFHDLVARPRLRQACTDRRCIGHFSQFSTETGRMIYRWQVNHPLSSADDPFRLAITGEDIGRLVRAVDEARGDLVDRVTQAVAEDVARWVEHAISLFRRRDTTEHDKRSAVIALAGILEERRELIRAELGRKDEGALFTLANEFAIRHQRRGQQGDYDPAFLDWMFWWYLATVELTEQILARQQHDEQTA
jgi:hypothetical protein